MKISKIFENFNFVEEQKKQAIDLLTHFSEHFKYVLLAGGAPRNWHFGKPANDYDIYVSRRISLYSEEQKDIDKEIKESIKELSSIYGFSDNRARHKENAQSNTYGGFILNSLYDFNIANRHATRGIHQKCQLIIIDDYNDQVNDSQSFSNKIFNTYDFGICMTSIDKSGECYNHKLFHSDVVNKTLTINIRQLKRNNDAGMQKLVQRFEKMEKMFPEHKMRIVDDSKEIWKM